MPVGYLPDMFGHVAQMPQILRLAGLEHAVVWRGVPAADRRGPRSGGRRPTARACVPSTSTARTRTAATFPTTRSSWSSRAHGYEMELGPARLPGGGLLLMNGTDHQLPQPWLGRVVAEANEIQDDYRFVVTSLAEYLPTQPTDGLPLWHGELRSGARANVLMGVASNRVDVHQACAAAERAIERRAEPLSALLLPAADYPGRAARARVAAARAQQRPRLVVRVQPRRGRRRRRWSGTRRRATSARPSHATPSRAWPRPSRPTPGSTVVVNPTQADRRGVDRGARPGRGARALRGRGRHALPDAGRRASSAATASPRSSPGRRCAGSSR